MGKPKKYILPGCRDGAVRDYGVVEKIEINGMEETFEIATGLTMEEAQEVLKNG